ncbi:erg24, C-14 sterol reductase, partial [Chytridiales sp. JEL 0842]
FTLACVVLVTVQVGLDPLLWIADNYLPLSTAAIIYSIFQSVALYLASLRKGDPLLAVGGNSGYPIYDAFIGRELNPRLFGLDLKYFCELRPGLIGWSVINLAFAAKQGFERAVASGLKPSEVGAAEAIGFVSNSMWLVVLFQGYYVVDALWNEAAILTTMDIIQDGFGFMLTFGDLAWVPFTYSVQSHFLSFNPIDLSPLHAASLVGLKLLGLYIFRGSNGQKNNFRTNPDAPECKKYKYIETKSGSKLLVSGWWGLARHINYTGDWIMAVSWSLPTGFSTPVTYFYAIYFAILLWHRELRDEHKCKLKYGKDWGRYCKAVPYKFVPYVY